MKIKTNTEEIENNRRTLEERQKKDRQNKIQDEVIESHKKNVEIDWNWQELEEKEDCKELAEVSHGSRYSLILISMYAFRILKCKDKLVLRSLRTSSL